jgi:hypothetical protein
MRFSSFTPARWAVCLFAGLATCAAILCAASHASAASISINAIKDNTILNDFLGEPTGGQTKSNGQGPLFIGVLNRSPFLRRALVYFDVAGSIPAGATIDSVELRLQMTAVGPVTNDTTISVHRLLADWGEAGSYAVGGTGADAQPGDATWLNTFFNTATWTNPGGDFAAAPSGSAVVDRFQGTKVWSSTPGLVADVQMWVDDLLLGRPPSNFGWLLKGPETDWGTARRFDSGEVFDGDARANAFPQITVPYMAPQLIVQYTPVPEPATLALACCSVVAFAASHRRRLHHTPNSRRERS